MANLDDLIDEIDDLLDDLEDIIGDDPPDPLPEEDKEAVDEKTSAALAKVDKILNPTMTPNMSPPNAGSVQGFIASDLAEYASKCAQLSQDAKDEVNNPLRANDDKIGDALKTLQVQIPNYRTEAGL